MEGLSIAANGLAVVSVAFQLTEACVKLYRFWESVEDAPQEIASINEDLQYLISIFKRIESDTEPVGQWIVEGIEHCRGKILELTNIVEKFEELRSPSRRKRKWAAFKAATHSKHVQRFRESLNETKSTLTLALVHQCVVQSRSHTYTVSANTSTFKRSQHHLTLVKSDLSLPSSRSIDPVPSMRQHLSVLPTHTEQYSHPDLSIWKTDVANTVLVGFEKNISDQTTAHMKIQELMLHAIGQTAIATFESNSLEIFAQDGYTMDRNGGLQARTFAYSENLRYCVSHHATSFRTAFGCVWIRKTILYPATKVDGADENTQCVTSFIFYPHPWIQWLGVRNGLEAITSAAERSCLFNCRLSVTRAIPEDSLLFELCRTGQTRAVETLFSKGLGSVVDTSPKGWKPLHFAAAGGHVDLCAMLIEAGADKTALVYEGPTSSILSPISLFVASAKDLHAEVKISMLRLFSDCIELTDARSDGWTVHEWLKRAYAKEGVPISQNSITWLFHSTATEEYVEFNAHAVWCGLQHAVRTALCYERRSRLLGRILDKLHAEYKSTDQSYVDAIGLWLALRVVGRVLLPMALTVGSFCQIKGFEWGNDDLTRRQYLQALPSIYTAWCHAVLDTTKNLECYLRLELKQYLRQIGYTGTEFLGALSYQKTTARDGDAPTGAYNCTRCAKNYSSLPSALVAPIQIAVTECTKANHRFGCVCHKLDNLRPSNQRAELPEYTGRYDINSVNDTDETATEDVFFDAETHLSPNVIASHDSTASGMFTEVAALLYRAHGRAWLGDYKADELLCAPCFLQQEQYIDEDGVITDFSSKPDHFDGLRFKW